MFTGIIEELGTLKAIHREGGNLNLSIESGFASQLKVEQSVAHDGICLTVTAIEGSCHSVTAIAETIQKTTIGHWKVGQHVNLERGMKLGDRLDGHIVQGHVDQTGMCIGVEDQAGSTVFSFSFDRETGNLTIPKGSITINGVSLTVVDSHEGEFSVAIIPYTMEHTTFHHLSPGDLVNLEFDVIGKYVSRLYSRSDDQ